MSEAAAITPIAETEDTVTLRRTDFEAFLEALEEAEDMSTLRAAEAAVERGEPARCVCQHSRERQPCPSQPGERWPWRAPCCGREAMPRAAA